MTIKTTILTHRPRVSLDFSSADDVTTIADDVTMTRQLWRDHVNSIKVLLHVKRERVRVEKD